MDVFDNDLQSMVNYSDETVPAAMPVMECKTKPKAAQQSEPAKDEAKEEVMDAAYAVIPAKRRGYIDKLYDMTKWLCICGSICYLMWWFEMNGLMAMEASYPCILVSAVIGSGGTVWSAMR